MATDAPVVGLLFGTQSGLDISIIDATDAIYDVPVTNPSGLTVDKILSITLNHEEIEKKKRLWTAVYTNYELLGWYTLTPDNHVLPAHMAIHRDMMAFNEAPLFLLMNCAPEADAKQLPLSIYGAEMHIINDTPTQIFVEIPFRLETAQAERVAVDQITKLTPTEGASTLEVQNQSLTTSLRVLGKKIAILGQILQLMQDGTLPMDHTVVRKASKICQQLPAIDSGTFHEQLLNELVDTLMMTYLASATKTTGALTELTDMYAMVYSISSSRRLM
jgi:COP9 signalosome complex subunit 6